jgi:DNA (cytosine-5)-methyltransferase 1
VTLTSSVRATDYPQLMGVAQGEGHSSFPAIACRHQTQSLLEFAGQQLGCKLDDSSEATGRKSPMKRRTCLDLFSGCGGMSLGMQNAGFDVLAAIDVDDKAIKVFAKNLPAVPHALARDLTKFSPQELAKVLGTRRVDVIVGGPPCQGFSTARQRDGSNSGPRLVKDERRQLYQEFLRYVAFFRPDVFVIENVLGIKSAAAGRYFTRVQEEARRIGYRVHPQVEKAFELGVPQKRIRQLIIGTRLDLASYFPGRLDRAIDAPKEPTVGEAIGDLPVLRAGTGDEEADYDMHRRKEHVSRYGRRYLYSILQAHRAKKLTAHVARPHSERDLRDFKKLREGEHAGQALKRGEKFEFPYDKENFKDRYTRQHRNRTCSTIVAHLSKDGLMFIHPTQNRSLTPREAARIQSFPDWFEFPVARTHQFRLIGNAVPPLVGKSLGLAIHNYLKKAAKDQVESRASAQVPRDHEQAAERLVTLVNAAAKRSLHRVPATEFRLGWGAISFLYPELHPNSALAHGKKTSVRSTVRARLREIESKLLASYFVQSGWPVALKPVAKEAWRRYHSAQLTPDEFYCNDAAIAAIRIHNVVEPDSDKSERALA